MGNFSRKGKSIIVHHTIMEAFIDCILYIEQKNNRKKAQGKPGYIFFYPFFFLYRSLSYSVGASVLCRSLCSSVMMQSGVAHGYSHARLSWAHGYVRAGQRATQPIDAQVRAYFHIPFTTCSPFCIEHELEGAFTAILNVNVRTWK